MAGCAARAVAVAGLALAALHALPVSLSLSVGNAEELSGHPLPFGDCTGGCAVVSIWVAHLERDGKGVVCHMVYVAPRFVSTGLGRLEWSLQE